MRNLTLILLITSLSISAAAQGVKSTISGGTTLSTTAGPSVSQLGVTTTSCPTATVGQAYTCTLSASNGVTPLSWTVSGSLPAGLELISTGSITGTPSATGSSSFIVMVQDSSVPPAYASANLSITVTSAAPPTQLTINTASCPGASVAVPYNCTINATGGVLPYTWSSSGDLTPVGLARANNVISGTPSAEGSVNYTVTVTDSATPTAGTASINLTITVGPTPTGCGFPLYNCSLQNSASFGATLSSMATTPPDAGCQTSSNPNTGSPCAAKHACTPGMNGTIQACGNIYGFNTIITESAYNGVQLVRASDAVDAQTMCATVDGGGAGIGPGGAAEFNVFSSDSQYIVMSCGNSTGIKWFNPQTMQFHTEVDPRGWVHSQSSGGASRWKVNYTSRFSYSNPHLLYSNSALPVIQEFTVSNGIIDDTAANKVADMSFAIPCWTTRAELVSHCGDWPGAQQQAQPGTMINPTANQASPRRVFALLNSAAPCTTGNVEPDWSTATNYIANNIWPPGGSSSATWMIQDGTCQWGDMFPPPQAGGAVSWSTGLVGDSTDTIFSVAMGIGRNQRTGAGNGQDSAGDCYATWYNSNTQTYSFWNSCVGSVYNTVCSGGTGYDCSGGQFIQTYLGNGFEYLKANSVWAQTSGTIKLMVIHADFASKNVTWGYITGGASPTGGCPFVDSTGTVVQPCGNESIYFWFYGTQKLWTSTLVDPQHRRAVGHQVPGYDTWVARGPNASAGYQYQGINLNTCTPTTSGCPLANGGWFKMRQPPIPPCTPQPCTGPGTGVPAIVYDYISFDEHSSWVSNNGTDTTPICTQGFSGGTYAPQSPFVSTFVLASTPFLDGEVLCFATDGSNKIFRQAYPWNTFTTGGFNTAAAIGSLSSDGQWWGINTDWWCTLGTIAANGAVGTGQTMCGMPLQLSHTYAVGEYVGFAFTAVSTAGRIYRISTAGTSGQETPPAAVYCSTAGCIICATPVSGGGTLAITGTSLTANVATYTFTPGTGAGIAVGNTVSVTGTTGGGGIFNANNMPVLSVSGNTFTTARTHADVVEATDAGTGTYALSNAQKWNTEPCPAGSAVMTYQGRHNAKSDVFLVKLQ